MITITAGPGDPIQLAAWIDYDHSGTYDADEKIGEGAYFLVPGDRRAFHTFQVPAAAQLGITRMRVRAVHVLPGEPTPMDPCYAYLYSEIEEYEIVIDGNTPLDCTGAPNGSANPGYSCNDGNSFTVFDFYQSNCTCAGFQTDCNGVVAGPALPGTPCDDGNANTGNDVFDAGCGCAGLPFDCLGVAGGPDVPGMPCNDLDQNTVNDMLTANCACIGQLYDCAGTLGGTALPGSPCDDGNPLSGGDLYDANCLCAGALRHGLRRNSLAEPLNPAHRAMMGMLRRATMFTGSTALAPVCHSTAPEPPVERKRPARLAMMATPTAAMTPSPPTAAASACCRTTALVCPAALRRPVPLATMAMPPRATMCITPSAPAPVN
ncbi:MAG: hypothetical protein IPG10_18215 [Flavobacteriales bacterium]|nr:hypothetical protein [Flavobacteriales bacterium]